VAATVPDARAQPAARGKARFRTGLVAYSYRQALQAKTMTYEDLIRIAVETGTDGIDMTVHWLPATTDDYLLPLRRLAYRNRVEIYSMGTRVRLAQLPPRTFSTFKSEFSSRSGPFTPAEGAQLCPPTFCTSAVRTIRSSPDAHFAKLFTALIAGSD